MAIEAFYAANAEAPLLMTGFNRRFSPADRRRTGTPQGPRDRR